MSKLSINSNSSIATSTNLNINISININKHNFKRIIEGLGYEVEAEFKFCPERRFRAAWKITKGNKSVLVEYEGIIGKARHTTIIGYSKHCEKYNIANSMGLHVFSYTVLNFYKVINDLERYYTKLGEQR